ncbi:MAG: hypothetical protein UU36_C0022G0006, partial [Candidatus Uhrbacteria bacterium GW2011_GWE2_41_1153]
LLGVGQDHSRERRQLHRLRRGRDHGHRHHARPARAQRRDLECGVHLRRLPHPVRGLDLGRPVVLL